MVPPSKDDALVAILVPAETREELDAQALKPATLEEIKAWPCASAEDENTLVDLLREVQARLSSIEGMRKEVTGPINASKRKIDAFFKRLSAPYEEAKDAIKGKLAGAENARREQLRQLQERAASAAIEGDYATAVAAKKEAVAAAESRGGASYQYAWEYEIEDLSKVPTQYLMVDERAVKMHLAPFGHSEYAEPIPGLRFTRVAKVIAK